MRLPCKMAMCALLAAMALGGCGEAVTDSDTGASVKPLPRARWQQATAGCEDLPADAPVESVQLADGTRELGVVMASGGHVLCVDSLAALQLDVDLREAQASALGVALQQLLARCEPLALHASPADYFGPSPQPMRPASEDPRDADTPVLDETVAGPSPQPMLPSVGVLPSVDALAPALDFCFGPRCARQAADK